jgi:hypothetical protein
MGRTEIALEELKMLQAIIARQDEFKMKTKSWAVTVLAAITTLYLTGRPPLKDLHFVVLSVLIVFAFLLVEGIYGATEALAENRVRKVEDVLRTSDPQSYDGPMIFDSLREKVTLRGVLKSITYPGNWGLYAGMVAFVATAVIYDWAACNMARVYPTLNAYAAYPPPPGYADRKLGRSRS